MEAASFSPDGMRIVTTDIGGTKVRNARTGASILELKGDLGVLGGASYSPDGTRITTTGVGGRNAARVWDARTGEPLLELNFRSGLLPRASWSADGTRILTWDLYNTPTVWDGRTGTPLFDLIGPTLPGEPAAFSPDGTRIVTGGRDGTVKVLYAGPSIRTVELKCHLGGVSIAAFSPDGTRIVTGGGDGTAKVWDTRECTLLLELKGHDDRFSSASFSPNGEQIVTVGHTAKVWDARAGAVTLELEGYTIPMAGGVSSAWDGTRIVIKNDIERARVWDARTGRELKGEPIPAMLPSCHISPDGRWFALAIGDNVEITPVQPDEEELAYRRLVMQPNFRLYRESYDAAIKERDDFAARFYLNLFPPPEGALIRAEAIVGPLFARLLLRDDVLAALKARPHSDPEIQAACLKLAETWLESANDCNNAAWPLVSKPGQPDGNYQRGLQLARAACRLDPENVNFLNTLGVAQYRCGLMAVALATLTRTNAMNEEKEPADLAFLALAQHRLGQSEEARTTLVRLREVMKDPKHPGNPEAKTFLREAEAIDLNRVFPADPFAR